MNSPEHIKIIAADNFTLHANLYCTIKNPKGIIQINSATGVRKEFYHYYAIFLQSQDFHVITFDYRGIGESRPPSLKGFVAHNHEWGKKDMTAVLEWADQNFQLLPKYVIGHSAGGQQLGMMANYHKISKAFLVGSSIGYWPFLSAPYRYFAALAFYVIFPLSNSLLGYVASKKLGLGEDLPKGVAQEWKKWCLRPQYFGEFLQELQPHFYKNISFPIHSLYAEDDPIANTKTVKALLEFYPNAPKKEELIYLKDLQVRQLGHFGFFSRSMKELLWRKPVDFFN